MRHCTDSRWTFDDDDDHAHGKEMSEDDDDEGEGEGNIDADDGDNDSDEVAMTVVFYSANSPPFGAKYCSLNYERKKQVYGHNYETTNPDSVKKKHSLKVAPERGGGIFKS